MMRGGMRGREGDGEKKRGGRRYKIGMRIRVTRGGVRRECDGEEEGEEGRGALTHEAV